MEEISCPRCHGSGDIPAPGGLGVTKCFACGGRGSINQRDAEWISTKWGAEHAGSTSEGKKPTKTSRTAKPAAKSPTRSTKTKAVTPAVPPAHTQGRSPLHEEASMGFLRGVKELLEGGAEVNARDDDGRTPLHWPAYRGHVEVVRLLIEYGADVNAADNNGRTPLKMATIGNHAEIVALLTEHGAQQ